MSRGNFIQVGGQRQNLQSSTPRTGPNPRVEQLRKYQQDALRSRAGVSDSNIDLAERQSVMDLYEARRPVDELSAMYDVQQANKANMLAKDEIELKREQNQTQRMQIVSAAKVNEANARMVDAQAEGEYSRQELERQNSVPELKSKYLDVRKQKAEIDSRIMELENQSQVGSVKNKQELEELKMKSKVFSENQNLYENQIIGQVQFETQKTASQSALLGFAVEAAKQDATLQALTKDYQILRQTGENAKADLAMDKITAHIKQQKKLNAYLDPKLNQQLDKTIGIMDQLFIAENKSLLPKLVDRAVSIIGKYDVTQITQGMLTVASMLGYTPELSSPDPETRAKGIMKAFASKGMEITKEEALAAVPLKTSYSLNAVTDYTQEFQDSFFGE